MATFESSRLGSKQHWDDVYKCEIATFQDIGDEGEAWFGEDVAQDMIDFASEFVPAESRPLVLDVGTGNGHLLYALVDAGYNPSLLTGSDYSGDSIRLCQEIAAKRGIQGIEFEVSDCLKPNNLFLRKFDLIFDKGTYDAISLSDSAHDIEQYPPAISSMMKDTATLCITSCNFTLEELKQQFARNSDLTYFRHLPKPTFTFGGAQGSTTTTVLFRKRV